MTIRARLNYEYGYDSFSLWITDKRPNGELYFLKIETIQSNLAGANAQPFIAVDNPVFESREFCQAIMDAAWEEGIRPKGFRDIKNETTALKSHLDDMRRLVFANTTPYNIVELEK